MFDEISYTFNAYGIDLAELRHYREQYVVDSTLHGRFISAINMFSDDKEQAYRDVSAVVTDCDLWSCGAALYNRGDLHLYGNRVAYLKKLASSKRRSVDILHIRKLKDNWTTAPRCDH